MAEFTREISGPNVTPAPELQTNTGSLGGDLIGAAQFGLELFAGQQAKERQGEAARRVKQLMDFEQGLVDSGVKRTKRVAQLERKINELAPNAEDNLFLRQQLATARGGMRVSQERIQLANQEEATVQQAINTDFSQAEQAYPDLAASAKRTPDGIVPEDEKIRIIREADKRTRQLALANEKKAEADELAKQGVAEQGKAVTLVSESLNERFNAVLSPVTNQFITMVNGLDSLSGEGIQQLTEINNNLTNATSMFRNQVESEFSQMLASVTDKNARTRLEGNRDALLNTLDSVEESLKADSLDKMKETAANLQLTKDLLELDGLNAFGTLAAVEQVFPNAGRFVFEALSNKQPQVMQQLEAGGRAGLNVLMSGSDKTMQNVNNFVDYHEQGNPDKASDATLTQYYQYSRNFINSGNFTNMSAQEMDKTAAGLVGVMMKVANEDDRDGIKNTTKLLNTDNFRLFMDALPEDKKATLGRITSEFNQEVLTDPTDGVFKKIGDAAKRENIYFDANSGQFKMEARVRGRGMFEDVSSVRSKQLIEQANKALTSIKDLSKYDPLFQNKEKAAVDFIVGENLPEGIEVRGQLSKVEFEARQQQQEQARVQEGVSEEERVNQMEQITALENRVLELTEQLQGGGRPQQQTPDYNAMAQEQGVDLSSFEDGVYEDGNGNLVTISNGQVVGVE